MKKGYVSSSKIQTVKIAAENTGHVRPTTQDVKCQVHFFFASVLDLDETFKTTWRLTWSRALGHAANIPQKRFQDRFHPFVGVIKGSVNIHTPWCDFLAIIAPPARRDHHAEDPLRILVNILGPTSSKEYPGNLLGIA